MHIGMLISAPLPAREGIGFYTWNLARHLVKQGHQVSVITRGTGQPTSREVMEGIEVWRPMFLPVYPFHVHLHNVFVNRVIQKLDPDIDIWHLHTPLVKFPKTKRPVLVTVHTPMKADTGEIPVKDLFSLAIRLQAAFSIRLEEDLFAKANQLVSVANSVAVELQAYGIRREQVAVLGNGADTEIFHPGPDLRMGQPTYFLTAGRLAPRKGLQDLLVCAEEVVKKYPACSFLIAGSGSLEQELRETIERRGLQNHVQLIGHVSDRDRMVSLYQGSAAYIHPAHYEGLPTVLLEAMACGRPVITTAVSGALDVVQDGTNGIMVPPHQPGELAKALFCLLETPGLGDRLGAAACQTIRQRYAWDVVSRNYLAQYKALQVGGSI